MTIHTWAQIALAWLLLLNATRRGPPIFRLYCVVAALLTAAYHPTNTGWLRAWFPAITTGLLVGRLLLAAEAITLMFKGVARLLALGTAGLAAAAVFACWRYRGLKLAPWVEIGNYVQIGTWLLLLVPLLICWKFGRVPAHCWILLIYLGGYAAVGMASTALHFFGAMWEPVNFAAYAVSILCAAAWLTLAALPSPRDGRE